MKYLKVEIFTPNEQMPDAQTDIVFSDGDYIRAGWIIDSETFRCSLSGEEIKMQHIKWWGYTGIGDWSIEE